MTRRVVLIVLLALLFLGLLGAFVGVTAGRDLLAAKAVLTAPRAEVNRGLVASARAHLADAHERLDGIPARLLGLVPVARQNVRAMRVTAEDLDAVLADALDLSTAVESIQGQGLVRNSTVSFDQLSELRTPLKEQAVSLARLQDDLQEQRSGWLLPPVWDALDELRRRSEQIHEQAARAARAVELSGQLLGRDGRRVYLVLFLNNAELRGAGGIPSAIGTVAARDGNITIGRFYYEGDLRDPPPYLRVPAPADFKKRYGHNLADTAFWVNTTMSPDIPDVAVVAARLFEGRTGIKPDGVVFADPRGLAALMPADSQLPAPRTGRKLSAADLPEYIYWHEYEELRAESPRRREALLVLGRQALRTTLQRGLGGQDKLQTVAEALAGGRLRFVPFEEDERSIVDGTPVLGEVPQGGDTVMVIGQNFGGDKLDFWTRENIEHNCEINEDRARCETKTTIANRVRPGLPDYIAKTPYPGLRNRPYGLVKRFLEVYVPGRAELTKVEVQGRPSSFYGGREDTLRVVGLNLDIPARRQVEVVVGYDLPLDNDGYALAVAPQPLAHDPQLQVALTAPSGWVLKAPDGSTMNGILRYSGLLNDELRFEARRDERSGLSRWWDRLVRFWREPVF